MALEFYFETPLEEDLTILVDAFASQYNYQEEVSNPNHDPNDELSTDMIPNPESAEDFMTKRIQMFLAEVATAFRAKQFDQGLVTPEEYTLGRKGYLDVVKNIAMEKITLSKRVI